MMHLPLSRTAKYYKKDLTPAERSLRHTNATEAWCKVLYDKDQIKASILNQYFSSVYNKK